MGQRIPVTQCLLGSLCNLEKQFVAIAIQPIRHIFEVGDLYREDREAGSDLRCTVKSALDSIGKENSIGKAGKRLIEFAFRDIGLRARNALGLAIGVHGVPGRESAPTCRCRPCKESGIRFRSAGPCP